MKATKFLMALVVATAAISCSKEEIRLELNTTALTLFSGNEQTITSPNGTGLKFSSRNNYIATVNASTGKVKAVTIGETVIDVSSDQGSAEVKVYVRPRYSTYKEPCTDFGKTRSEIIAMLGAPTHESSTSIGYIYDSKVHPMDMYSFDDNDRLESSSAIIGEEYAIEAMEFLGERYLPVTVSGGIYYFANGIENSTMVVMFGKMPGYKLYQIMYMPTN